MQNYENIENIILQFQQTLEKKTAVIKLNAHIEPWLQPCI
jgi:hypothetical protein